MTAQAAQAFASHLINQTLSSIALLESLSLINPVDASLIRQKLPSPTGPFPSLVAPATTSPSSSFANLNINSSSPSWTVRHAQEEAATTAVGGSGGGSQQFSQQNQAQAQPQVQVQAPMLPPRGGGSRHEPPEVRAKALWDFSGTQPDDLQFRGGDVVIIDEEVNDQWYRGRVIPNGHNGPLPRSGLFPANYVEKLPPPPATSSSYYSGPPPPQAMIPYQQEGPMQGYYDQKPPAGHMQVMSPQEHQLQQQQPQTMVVQQEPTHKGKFGKIGAQLGNSAVTGFGFGAGSAVASEMVHAIF
ncbi:hypothetical protein IAR55_000679 [Kwoniella newhampshirensis]|uniref:SH3 domain-containing protein n=1 Tax=Kwoniella newhampshirensis TaxID=1651941 RepID=A0AAW0Z7G3_9TREE